jgi:hypothetical protein
MHKGTTVILLALAVALMPFLGFPSSWKIIFYVVAGFGIAIFSFLDKKEILENVQTVGWKEDNQTDVFVQNGVIHEEMAADKQGGRAGEER